jgi:hypothetical protein
MVNVVLELDQVGRRIAGDERLMNFNSSFEAKAHVTVERYVTLFAQLIESVEVLLLAKRHAKVTRVHG